MYGTVCFGFARAGELRECEGVLVQAVGVHTGMPVVSQSVARVAFEQASNDEVMVIFPRVCRHG